MKSAMLWALALFVCVGCTSEEDIQDEWDLYVEENNACMTADDCVLVSADCPLGCYAAVSADKEAKASEKAQSLISSYARGRNESCQYNCVPAEAICVDQRCEAELEF